MLIMSVCLIFKHCLWHFSVFVVLFVYLLCGQQVRDSDPKDPKRERIVELIDDFRITGENGERILCIQTVCTNYAVAFLSLL